MDKRQLSKYNHAKQKINKEQKNLPEAMFCNNNRRTATQAEIEMTLSVEEIEFRTKELIFLSTVSWYWGEIVPTQICHLMQDSPDGTFLVNALKRTEGNNYRPNYSIAVKLQREVFIFKVQYRNGELSLDFQNPHQPRALTLFALVSKILQISHTYGNVGELLTERGAVLVSLKYPISRISSLKAHCRRVIRLKKETSSTDVLPIPKELKRYLNTI